MWAYERFIITMEEPERTAMLLEKIKGEVHDVTDIFPRR